MAEREIIGFLTRCLDEDEVIARATRQASLSWRNFDMDGELRDSGNAGTVAHVPAEEDRVHIARHDPAHVLAEVAAKRQLLKLHIPERDLRIRDGRYVEDPPKCTVCTMPYPKRGNRQPYPCDVLRLLAAPYADRPGYNPAWRKDG